MSVNYHPRGSSKEFKSAFINIDPGTGTSLLKLISTDDTIVSVAAKWIDNLSLLDRIKLRMGRFKAVSIDIGNGSGEMKELCINVKSLAKSLGISFKEAEQVLADESPPRSFSDGSASFKSIFNPRAQPHANFRTTHLSLKGRKSEVAGMAHPFRYSTTD